jgi:hypothetical protein
MPTDACGHEIKDGCQVHLHGEVTAVGDDAVTVKLHAPEGQEGQSVTVKPCCVRCDEWQRTHRLPFSNQVQLDA